MALSATIAQSIVANANQSGNVIDVIAQLFSTAANAQKAHDLFTGSLPGLTRAQRFAVARALTTSSKWIQPGAAGADAANLTLLGNLIGALAGGSGQTDPGGYVMGGNLVAGLAANVPT